MKGRGVGWGGMLKAWRRRYSSILMGSFNHVNANLDILRLDNSPSGRRWFAASTVSAERLVKGWQRALDRAFLSQMMKIYSYEAITLDWFDASSHFCTFCFRLYARRCFHALMTKAVRSKTPVNVHLLRISMQFMP